MNYDYEDHGPAELTYYCSVPVLGDNETDAVKAELMFGEDGSIFVGGRMIMETMGWRQITGLDSHYYDGEADPDATNEQKVEFCIGIEAGYEFTLGVLANIFKSRQIKVVEALGLGEDDVAYFVRIRSNQLLIDASSELAELFDEATSSDLLFMHAGNVLGGDHNLSDVIEDQEAHIRQQLEQPLSGVDTGLVEYHVSGFMHGVSSVLGFMVMAKEKVDIDQMEQMLRDDTP